LEKNNVNSNRELLIKNLGLGLVDHYWIKDDNENRNWNEVNYFENEFTDNGDDIFLGEYEINTSQEHTPNNVSSGMLPKKWIIKSGERYLMKGSEGAYHQEPFNEHIVSNYLDILNINHVKYELIEYKNYPYSLCKNMLNNDEELISAVYVDKVKTKDKYISNFEHYINCCEYLGLKNDVREELEKMITIDYLAANTDRHWSNFGIIRNARTLQSTRIAPLFDNGAAFYTKLYHEEIPVKNSYLKCESFKTKQNDNIKLVKDFSWLDKNKIDILPDIVSDVLSKNKYINEIRKNTIVKSIRNRIVMLKDYICIDAAIKNS
jgi:hypothetical protein